MTDKATHTPANCPFCGSDEISHGIEFRYPDDIAHVQCHECDAFITAPSEIEALTAWNTRADSHHRLVEALEAERTWHEDHDKAISKQPNANTGDNGWRRMEHQERIAEIDAALKEARHG